MKVVRTLSELRTARRGLEGVVGFVPTMGALHPGHASLITAARPECESVLVSIYVNPTQFGPGEDFESYPRTEEADLKVCESAGADIVWFPRTEEIYPPGCETVVSVPRLGSRFEGSSRPGHFDGVTTVVSKLFLATGCHRAYFGQKDLQQLFVIRRIVTDLLFPVEIVGVPIAREVNGLARSSRNEYLSAADRQRAGSIYEGLECVEKLWRAGGATVSVLKAGFHKAVETAMPEAEIERCDLLSENLNRALKDSEILESGYCSVAVKLGKVRLIDNIRLCS